MNIFKVLLLSVLLPLTQMSLADDYVDLLNLSGYEEGDIPTHLLGEQITVRQEIKDGKTIKFVSGQSDKGKINYKIPNLSKDFEIVFELAVSKDADNFTSDDQDILISFSANNEVKFSFNLGYYVQLGNNSKVMIYGNTGWNRQLAANVLKIKVENGNVKTYINSEFFQSMTLEQPDKVYNDLLITEIGKDDKIYSIKVKNLGSSTTPITPPGTTTPTTATLAAEFDIGKQAGIQQCKTDPASCGISMTGSGTGGVHANFNPSTGELYIPLVDVPGAFGGVQTYEVYLKQQPLKFSFDLDMNRLMLK